MVTYPGIGQNQVLSDVSIVMMRDICHEIVLNLGVVVAVEEEEEEVAVAEEDLVSNQKTIIPL